MGDIIFKGGINADFIDNFLRSDFVTRTASSNDISLPANKNVVVSTFTVSKAGYYLFKPNFRISVVSNSNVGIGIYDTPTPSYNPQSLATGIIFNEGYQNGNGGMEIYALYPNVTYRIIANATAATSVQAGTAGWYYLRFLKEIK